MLSPYESKVISKSDTEEAKQAAEQEKEREKEGRDSKDSLSRERVGTKDSSKSSRDRIKSGKSDRGEKEKPTKSAEKSRSGSKLSIIDSSPVRTKSGGASRGRRMSKMEKPMGEIRSRWLCIARLAEKD